MRETQYVGSLLVISLIGFLIQYGFNMYLAHQLGNYFYGEYSIALKLLVFLVSLILFGTDIGSTSFLARYLDTHKDALVQDYLIWNIKVVALSFLCVRLLSIILIIGISTMHVLGVRSIHQHNLYTLVLWISPIVALFSLFTNYLNCKDLVFTNAIITNIVNYVIQFLLFFVTLNLLKFNVDNFLIIAILALSYVLLSILTLFFLNRDFLQRIYSGLFHLKNISIYDSRWFHRSTQLILSNLIYFLAISVDLFVVKFVSKNTMDVGHYAAALTITYILWYTSGNLYLKLIPTMSEALSTQHGRLQFQQRLNQTNKMTFIILTSITMLILFFSSKILLLFGASYIQAKTALIYLTIGGWFFGLSRLTGTMLLYAGFESLVCWVAGVRLICMLVLLVPVTYWFGIAGTAMVTSTAFAVSYIVFIFYVKTKLGINAMSMFTIH